MSQTALFIFKFLDGLETFVHEMKIEVHTKFWKSVVVKPKKKGGELN